MALRLESAKILLFWLACILLCRQSQGSCLSLVGGKNDKEGSVLYTENGKSSILCGQYFDTNSAAIACKSIGHSTGVAMSTKNNYFNTTENFLDITQYYFYCFSKNPASISECGRYPVSSPSSSLCKYPYYVPGLICDFQFESVELVGGPAANEGTIVYTYDGKSGVFVDGFDRWTAAWTDVACRMLGYSGGESFFKGQYTGTASNKIFLVGCEGTESSLTECQNYGLQNGDVDPSSYYGQRTVGVVCTVN